MMGMEHEASERRREATVPPLRHHSILNAALSYLASSRTFHRAHSQRGAASGPLVQGTALPSTPLAPSQSQPHDAQSSRGASPPSSQLTVSESTIGGDALQQLLLLRSSRLSAFTSPSPHVHAPHCSLATSCARLVATCCPSPSYVAATRWRPAAASSSRRRCCCASAVAGAASS